MHDFITLSPNPSSSLLQNLYARMLLARTVDAYARTVCEERQLPVAASCRGHEAAQVGSAVCIEVGKDFTLPYYRDLGVVLTIGMTPYEVFRTCLQRGRAGEGALQLGYHKHNTITGAAPVATQILHAAGIAFACKLRKASVVTVAYCGDGAIVEPDFLEGIRFAALHRLPAVFICEQDCSQASSQEESSLIPSCTDAISLPEGLTHRRIDGSDVLAVYTAMQQAMQQAREGQGPVLLEMYVTRSLPGQEALRDDPLACCQRYLQEQGCWDEAWAAQLTARVTREVEQALYDALRDTPGRALEP